MASDIEASVLKIWGVGSTFTLPSLPGPLLLEVVVPIRVHSMGQIDQFKIILILQDHGKKKDLRNNNTKKCKYEHTMSMFPWPLGMK